MVSLLEFMHFYIYHRGKDENENWLVLHELLQLLDEDEGLTVQNIGVCL